jgi:hypothetical protein
MLSRLIDPRLLASLPDHFNSYITIANAIETTNDYNEVITEYVPNTQLTNIQCYVERGHNTGTGSGEQRQQTQTLYTDSFLIALTGYYPQITQGDQAIIIGTGVKHNIKRVIHDDSASMTTLETEIINQVGT